MKRRRGPAILNVTLAVLVVAAAGGAYLIIHGDGSPASAAGRTVTVTRGTVERTVSASGTVNPHTTQSASFATSGTVRSISVSVGQRVRKGQILARLNAASQRRAVSAAWLSRRAAIESLQSTLAGTTTTVSSGSGSGSSGSGSGSTTGASSGSSGSGRSSSAGSTTTVTTPPTAEQIAQAKASLASASSSYYSAVESLAGTQLRAPIAGTVVAVNGTVGGSSSGSGSSTSSSSSSGSGSGSSSGSGSGSGSGATSGFVTIEDLSHLDAVADFSETDAASLRVGQPATITFDARPGVSVTARVTSIDPVATVSNNVVEYGVTFRLTQRPANLRAGESLQVTVTTGRAQNVLVVPSTAVTGSGRAATVTVLRSGKQAVVPVTVGMQGDITSQITSGLQAGDQVVITPSSTTGTGSGGFLFGPGGFGGGGGLGGALGGGARRRAGG